MKEKYQKNNQKGFAIAQVLVAIRINYNLINLI
jgi:hypothetical protein